MAITGLNWTAALSLIPEGVDRERVIALLRQWEAGMLEGGAHKPAGE